MEDRELVWHLLLDCRRLDNHSLAALRSPGVRVLAAAHQPDQLHDLLAGDGQAGCAALASRHPPRACPHTPHTEAHAHTLHSPTPISRERSFDALNVFGHHGASHHQAADEEQEDEEEEEDRCAIAI